MRCPRAVLGLSAAVLLAGCAEPEREWLKVDQPYTVEEFQRDVRACTRAGTLDEGCMRGRGWVSVNPRREKPPEPPTPAKRY
jgi:hypothetical protein